MKLLVKRDTNLLVKTEGTAQIDSDVPKSLRVPRVVSPELVEHFKDRSENDDLMIAQRGDYDEIEKHLTSDELDGSPISRITRGLLGIEPQIIPGLWSGYRSTLVYCSKTDRLFRLKGVALNPENPKIVNTDDGWIIAGGQKAHNAKYEKEQSDKWAKTLEWHGIEPAMKVKGLWEYPVLARKVRPTATLSEVVGDTRVDEVLVLLDHLYTRGLRGDMRKDITTGKPIFCYGGETSTGRKLIQATKELMYDIGYTTGRLKKLMDKSGQTWSCPDSSGSNAHWGNIVLSNGTNKLKVGIVDFDASCDSFELGKREIRRQQRREYDFLTNIKHLNPISSRAIVGGKISRGLINTEDGPRVVGIMGAREEFIRGIIEGYAFTGDKYNNEIDIGKLDAVFTLLRESGVPFTFDVGRARAGDDSIFSKLSNRNDDRNSYILRNDDREYYDLFGSNNILKKKQKSYSGSILEDVINYNSSFQSFDD
ncbi:MAG: hypothetical protein AABW79_00415 [Nanoarchaeota archaeon]